MWSVCVCVESVKWAWDLGAKTHTLANAVNNFHMHPARQAAPRVKRTLEHTDTHVLRQYAERAERVHTFYIRAHVSVT